MDAYVCNGCVMGAGVCVLRVSGKMMLVAVLAEYMCVVREWGVRYRVARQRGLRLRNVLCGKGVV